jgi:hypothetical protein
MGVVFADNTPASAAVFGTALVVISRNVESGMEMNPRLE